MSPFWLGFNSTIILIGGWKFVKDKFAESYHADEDHGEDVRNALAGSDIIPKFTGSHDPFKDWAMMQKGYQGMRMMNNSDDFDAETVCQDGHLAGIDFIPWFEEAEGPDCYITGLPNPAGDIEGEDNICEPCQSKWIYDSEGPEGEGYYRASSLRDIGTLLTEDRLHQLEGLKEELNQLELGAKRYRYGAYLSRSQLMKRARLLSKIAALEGSHDDPFMIRAEGRVRRHALDRFTKKRKPSRDTFRQRGRRAAVKSMFANEVELKKGNVRSISGGDVKLRKLQKDKDLKPADAVERLEISAESGDTVYYIDYVSHDGHLWGDAGALNYGETGPYATKEGAEAALSKMLADEVLEWEDHFEDLGAFTYELAPDGDMRLKPPNMDLDEFQWEYSMPTNKSIHQYNGLIYEAGVRDRQIKAAEGNKGFIPGIGKVRFIEVPTPEPKYDEEGRRIRVCSRCFSRKGYRTNPYRRKTKESVREGIEKGIYDEGDWEEVTYWCPGSEIRFPREGEGERTTPHEWTEWESTPQLDAKQQWWAEGKDLMFNDWLDQEIESHGNITLREWGDEEEESHLKKYGADEFNAAVYRGKKPVSQLGYAERAVMMDKMIEQARIEQSLLELEAAIKMGLITEDEIMKQLSERFGA